MRSVPAFSNHAEYHSITAGVARTAAHPDLSEQQRRRTVKADDALRAVYVEQTGVQHGLSAIAAFLRALENQHDGAVQCFAVAAQILRATQQSCCVNVMSAGV